MEAQGWRPCQEAQTPRMEMTGATARREATASGDELPGSVQSCAVSCYDVLCVHQAARMVVTGGIGKKEATASGDKLPGSVQCRVML